MFTQVALARQLVALQGGQSLLGGRAEGGEERVSLGFDAFIDITTCKRCDQLIAIATDTPPRPKADNTLLAWVGTALAVAGVDFCAIGSAVACKVNKAVFCWEEKEGDKLIRLRAETNRQTIITVGTDTASWVWLAVVG